MIIKSINTSVKNQIKLKTIEPEKIEVYEPENNIIYIVNEYEFLYILSEIKERKLKGYKYSYKGSIYNIDKNGNLEYYPEGLLDTMSYYYSKLI